MKSKSDYQIEDSTKQQSVNTLNNKEESVKLTNETHNNGKEKIYDYLNKNQQLNLVNKVNYLNKFVRI